MVQEPRRRRVRRVVRAVEQPDYRRDPTSLRHDMQGGSSATCNMPRGAQPTVLFRSDAIAAVYSSSPGYLDVEGMLVRAAHSGVPISGVRE